MSKPAMYPGVLMFLTACLQVKPLASKAGKDS